MVQAEIHRVLSFANIGKFAVALI